MNRSLRSLAYGAVALATAASIGCGGPTPEPAATAPEAEDAVSAIDAKLAQYVPFRLTTEIELSDAERQMVPLLIEAAQAMDGAFWTQAYGDPDALMPTLGSDAERRYAELNYGPWDRLDGNAPFVDGVGPKPKGANFYPADLTREQLDAAAAENPALLDSYTMVRRSDDGSLQAIPYAEYFADAYGVAAEKLRAAAELAEDEGLKRYLGLRADALLANDYLESDLAWMDMKSNGLDIVIGPIENYEDKLVGQKTANSAYVLVKDRQWSERLSKYATMLPALQKGLPVPDAYKQEEPGSDSDLGAYDVVYYAGDCNAGSKTIAINLPNDERVQLEKGTRRLQLKNAMRAKFDEILVPIAGVLMAEDQRSHITFDAFFGNTMFHEVAHGLGIKNTLDGKGTVREALGEKASALEEGKADMLGLYMVTELHAQGEMGEAPLMDNYATFLAGIFRSIRFGSASSHGVANLVRFNFFAEHGAFSRDEATGTYRVEFDKMQEATNALSEKILTLQGDGDREGVEAFVAKYGQEGEQLRADLDRLSAEGIPVDVVFEQGVDVLGL
ncbi:MAG: Zn-dependent hydrolase [Acidobacteriota bacterium]